MSERSPVSTLESQLRSLIDLLLRASWSGLNGRKQGVLKWDGQLPGAGQAPQQHGHLSHLDTVL